MPKKLKRAKLSSKSRLSVAIQSAAGPRKMPFPNRSFRVRPAEAPAPAPEQPKLHVVMTAPPSASVIPVENGAPENGHPAATDEPSVPRDADLGLPNLKD